MFKVLATHVAVDVADLNAAKQFLEDCLGLVRLRELNRPDIGPIAWYPGVELQQAQANRKPNELRHLAWQVDNLEEAIRHLKQSGANFEFDEPRQVDAALLDTNEIVRYIFFDMPAGLRGELYEVNPAPVK